MSAREPLSGGGAPPHRAGKQLRFDRLVAERARLMLMLRADFLSRRVGSQESAGETPTWRDDAEALAAFLAASTEGRSRSAEIARLTRELDSLGHAPFDVLRRAFALTPPEQDLVLMAFALLLEPSLRVLVRAISPYKGHDRLSDGLASRLFASRPFGLWRPDRPLARWQIIRQEPGSEGPNEPLTLDPAIAAFLDGEEPVPADFINQIRPIERVEPLPSWDMEGRVKVLRARMERARGAPIIVAVSGEEGTGRRSFTSALLDRLGLRCFVADMDATRPDCADDLVLQAHRLAYLTGAVPVFAGRLAAQAALPTDLAPFPLEFHIRREASAESAWPARPVTLAIALTVPDQGEREHLWLALCHSARRWPRAGLARLAREYRATPGLIRQAAEAQPAQPRAAASALRALSEQRFGPYAQRVESGLTLNDLVLPERVEQQVRQIIAEARLRHSFWEDGRARRLFPQGRGIVTLFTGPPGTGKTMSAQVITQELGLDLYRLEMSAIVSKYIGETMENLQRVLAAARGADVALLIDEADGMLAQRTELVNSNDRYANQDTGYLLQMLEQFDGIAFLASNRRRNIDEAFIRRLRHVVEFPAPDEAARLALWSKISRELFGASKVRALQPVFIFLARRLEMSGAQIKQAALTAALSAAAQARPVGVRDFMDGVDGELRKEGRVLVLRDRSEMEALA